MKRLEQWIQGILREVGTIKLTNRLGEIQRRMKVAMGLPMWEAYPLSREDCEYLIGLATLRLEAREASPITMEREMEIRECVMPWSNNIYDRDIRDLLSALDAARSIIEDKGGDDEEDTGSGTGRV